MKIIKNLFKLPSPVELGWSKYNALESRDFPNDPPGRSWEEWHETVKSMHPIKYFFVKTLTFWFTVNIWNKLKDFKYWIVSYIIPSRRFHFLDLRQPQGVCDSYQWGWTDVDSKMLYAMFNLLGEYLNKEDPADLTDYYSLEEIEAELNLKRQHENLVEAKIIYNWWTAERKEDYKVMDDLLMAWVEARRNKSPNVEYLWQLHKQCDEEFDKKEEEMLIRLIKIRKSLWT